MTDLEWCRTMLPKVSRTFALAIDALADPWVSWITSSYLVCRVADTVEDAPAVSRDARRSLFDALDLALRTGEARPFVARAGALPDDDDGELAHGLGRVLAPIAGYPPPVQRQITRWVSEMISGMAEYAERRARSGDGSLVLDDEPDLLRYCHFVAGTVGGLLTELFVLGSEPVRERASLLRPNAEGFALLLQLTNIVKDVREDVTEGRCFVPRSVCRAHGLDPSELFAPAHGEATSRAIRTLIRLARAQVPTAERYVDALPHYEPSLRRFCAIPLLLATHTLDFLDADPTGGARKVDRAAVADVLRQVERLAAPGSA